MSTTILRVGESRDHISWTSVVTRDCKCGYRLKGGRTWPCGRGPCLLGPSRLLDMALQDWRKRQ